MKKLITFCLFALFSFSLYSQGNLVAPKWTIKKFGISLGFDRDMLRGMDHTYFLSTARGETNFNYENLNLKKDFMGSMACENPHIRLNLTLLPPAMRNTELNLALVGIFNRIDYISYESPDKDWSDPGYQYLSFDANTNEIDLEASLLKRMPLGRSGNFYLGGGTNLGVSFAGNLYVSGNNVTIENDNVIGLRNDVDPSEDYYDMEYFHDQFDIKTGFSQRVFAQAGISFTVLRRFELGVDYRHGLGYRAHGGTPLKMTELQSIGASMRWVLR